MRGLESFAAEFGFVGQALGFEQCLAIAVGRVARVLGDLLGEVAAPRRCGCRARRRCVIRPKACASWTSIVRPVSTRSSARPWPTIFGRRCVPPSISGTPQRRSAQPKVAVVVATRRSHHSASSKPPARQWPEMAAIVGLGDSRRVKPSGPPGASASSVSIALRSAPAQKASSPAPVRTRIAAPASLTNALNASSSCCAVAPSMALWRSGRSIVTSAAEPRRS